MVDHSSGRSHEAAETTCIHISVNGWLCWAVRETKTPEARRGGWELLVCSRGRLVGLWDSTDSVDSMQSTTWHAADLLQHQCKANCGQKNCGWLSNCSIESVVAQALPQKDSATARLATPCTPSFPEPTNSDCTQKRKGQRRICPRR